jgi:hypothetical protein
VLLPCFLPADQYRLCPANSPLTEECFQKMPLKFAEPAEHRALYKDKNVSIPATIVPDSVTVRGARHTPSVQRNTQSLSPIDLPCQGRCWAD